MTGLGTDVDLVDVLVGATAERAGLPGRAVVALTVDDDPQAVFEIVDGRVSGPADGDDVGVTVPLRSEQLASFVAGDDSLARAYMRGDVKPVGSTGPLLAVVELLEDGAVLARLSELAPSLVG
jgi:hypothetical protein